MPSKLPLFQKHLSSSLEETHALGIQIASFLKAGDIVAFFGDLGSGKTTLIQSIISTITKVPKEAIQSPTFLHLITYEGEIPISHFDLYRLDQEQFLEKGFLEYFDDMGICLIEWSEKISSLLPKNIIEVTIETIAETKRTITLSKKGER